MDSNFRSKKFVGFVIAQISWKAILILCLLLGIDSGKIDFDLFTLISLIVLITGFVEVAYINGQATLDKYLRITEMVVDSGHDVSFKDMKIEKKTAPPPAVVVGEDEVK